MFWSVCEGTSYQCNCETLLKGERGFLKLHKNVIIILSFVTPMTVSTVAIVRNLRFKDMPIGCSLNVNFELHLGKGLQLI